LPPWDCGPGLTDLVDDSLRRYPEWVGEIERESGVGCEFLRSGMLVVPPYDRDRAEGWLRAREASFRIVDCRDADPFLSCEGEGLLLEDVPQVRNPRLLRALKGSLRARDALLVDGADAVGFEGASGQADAVLTRDGRRCAAGAFVVCAGAGTSGLLPDLPPSSRIRPVRGQMMLYRLDPRETPRHAVLRGGFYLVPRLDGHLLAGSTVEEPGTDPAIARAATLWLAGSGGMLSERLRGLDPISGWDGLRPAAPGGLPVIDRHPRLDNVFVHSGHFRYGLTTAPASAAILRQVVGAGGAGQDSPFRIDKDAVEDGAGAPCGGRADTILGSGPQ